MKTEISYKTLPSPPKPGKALEGSLQTLSWSAKKYKFLWPWVNFRPHRSIFFRGSLWWPGSHYQRDLSSLRIIPADLQLFRLPSSSPFLRVSNADNPQRLSSKPTTNLGEVPTTDFPGIPASRSLMTSTAGLNAQAWWVSEEEGTSATNFPEHPQKVFRSTHTTAASFWGYSQQISGNNKAKPEVSHIRFLVYSKKSKPTAN